VQTAASKSDLSPGSGLDIVQGLKRRNGAGRPQLVVKVLNLKQNVAGYSFTPSSRRIISNGIVHRLTFKNVLIRRT
jgi:hypothetical protein